jgi:hypothetical protein
MRAGETECNPADPRLGGVAERGIVEPKGFQQTLNADTS